VQKRDEEILYSASDLVNYLECEHLTALDLIDLETPLPKTKDSDQAKLIQDKGYAHEADFLAVLKARHSSLIDIAAIGGNLEQKIANTLQAMRDGFEIIFQATLRDGSLIGHADFLRKVSRPSELGDWSYEVMDNYPAIEAVLTQSLPRIRGHAVGSPVAPADNAAIPHIIDAISNLDGSYLFVQGPPGAGKTYTGYRRALCADSARCLFAAQPGRGGPRLGLGE
jgi:hypothetical protein